MRTYYFYFNFFAEREGFEPPVPFWSTHAFQACQISHSCISPVLLLFLQRTKLFHKSTHACQISHSCISPVLLLFLQGTILLIRVTRFLPMYIGMPDKPLLHLSCFSSISYKELNYSTRVLTLSPDVRRDAR